MVRYFTAASRNNAVSAEQVSQLLKGSVKLSEDGSVEVYDTNGTPRYNDKGELLTVDELVSDFLTANPHFVKASQGGARISRGGWRFDAETYVGG